MTSFIPLFAAIISALVILYGYVYQKKKERDASINETRKELYNRLIQNLSERLDMFEIILQTDEEIVRSLKSGDFFALSKVFPKRFTEFDDNLNKGREILSLISLYGSDEAIKVCVEFFEQFTNSLKSGQGIIFDKGLLLLNLRRSIYPKTKISPNDINLLISKGSLNIS